MTRDERAAIAWDRVVARPRPCPGCAATVVPAEAPRDAATVEWRCPLCGHFFGGLVR
jgi:hypothetical protein